MSSAYGLSLTCAGYLLSLGGIRNREGTVVKFQIAKLTFPPCDIQGGLDRLIAVPDDRLNPHRPAINGSSDRAKEEARLAAGFS